MDKPTEIELFLAYMWLDLEEAIEDPSHKVRGIFNAVRPTVMRIVSIGEDNGLLKQEAEDGGTAANTDNPEPFTVGTVDKRCRPVALYDANRVTVDDLESSDTSTPGDVA